MKLDFDPYKAAHYEVEAWKAHHVGKRARLLRMVLGMHREVFGLGRVKALIACRPLVSAIRAHNRVEKDYAQRELELYYFLLKRFSGYAYSERDVAAKEAVWWWLHDDLEHVVDKSPLTQAFADLYAAFLGVPVGSVVTAATHRTQATVFHDVAEDPKTTPAEADVAWEKTEDALEQFYTELFKVSQSA